MDSNRYTDRLYGGRFRAVRVLRDAQGVVTLLAIDEASGAEVVVKAARADTVPPAASFRFEHDVHTLRLFGRSISPVLGGGRDGDLLYVATELVQGSTLAERLAAGPLPLADALAIAGDVAASLRDAHVAGVLHHDIQPGNVVLRDGAPRTPETNVVDLGDDPADPRPRAVLVGFGLPRLGRFDGSIREQAVEQVLYVSPEQAGLIDHEPDERSDLYSLGLVLYACLAGHPPFTGPDASAVLREHLAAPAPSLRAHGVRAPAAVDEVVQRLLRKDPRDRYRTAEAVLEDLKEIAAALRRGEEQPDVAIGSHDRRPTLVEPAFIARGAELDVLEVELDAAVRGAGGLAYVEASSGVGKTRLLDELALRSLVRGVRVFRGQGVDRAARRPYQVLADVAAEVVRQSEVDAAFGDGLRSRLGADAPLVAAALPSLAQVMGLAGARPLASHDVEPAVRALASLLDALGTPEVPALVLLDDCQWADELTARLLVRWHAQPPDRRHVLVVAAFREEDVDEAHRLRQIQPRVRVRPAPFHDDDVTRLVESMAGPVPRAAVEAVARYAQGNLFMASAVLRGLVESRALVAQPAGWVVDEDALADVRSSARAAGFLARRLELLPEDALRLLQVGAVLGKTFDFTLAAELAGLSSDLAVRAIDVARRRNLVWTREGPTTFVHDKLREALLDGLVPADRTKLHAAAAERIERDDRERVFDLAYHFAEAGTPERALAYALEAGASARRQHALEVAERQYRIAEQALGVPGADTPRGVALAVARGLGEVLMLQGDYDGASRYLALAADLVGDELERAELDARLAELAFKRNDLGRSGELAENALRALGYRVPRSRLAFVFAAIREIAVQALHSVAPKRFTGRRDLAVACRDLLAARLYSRLAHVFWFSRGPVATLWAHLCEMNRLERYPATAELAQAYSEHAPAMVLVPWFRRGMAYVRRSLEIRRSFGDVWGQGQSLSFLSIVMLHAARFRECVEHAGEAIRLLERTGDRWEQNIARAQLAYAHLRLGNMRRAIAEADRLCRDGAEIGDPQAVGIGLEIRSKATGGNVDAAALRREIERPTPDVQLRAHLAQAEAVRLLAEGRPAEAVRVLDTVRTAIRRACIKQEYVVPVWPWLVTALRVQAETEATPRAARRVLRRAGRVALVARVLGRQYRSNLPHALRESGLVAARRGRLRRARRFLDRSLRVAERLELRYEHARTLQARARLGVQLGWPNAAADLTRARESLAAVDPDGAQGTPDEATLSLADRFDKLLDAGRRIAGALTPPLIFDAVHEATLSTLRGQRCVLLRARAGDMGFEPVGPDAGTGWDAELAERAVSSGSVVVSEQEDGMRSALYAPVTVRGRRVACVWVGHTEVTGLFGPEEERLAGFIATLAGAALENAEGFAEIQAFSRTLEAKVSERTVQLAEANAELDESLGRLRSALERERDVSRRLRELDELKSDFLSTVSHELRTPLTSIQGFSETLVVAWDRLDEARRLDLVRRVANQSRDLGELIFTLLDFSLAERGRLVLHPGPEPVAGLIAESVDRLSRQLAGRVVSVDADEALLVLADRRGFARTFDNLLTNAAKFSPPDAPVEVAARRAAGGVQVSVRDHGRGIEPEERAQIFERFYRIERGDTAPARGTGIGLAIAKQFAEAQGGRIEVDSVPGEGSTFTFTLPEPAATPHASAAS